MALVTLHFLTQYGDIYKASEKEYVYETDLTLYKNMIYTKDNHKAFTIENDKGYTYRNSLVIFTGFYRDAQNYYVSAKREQLPDSIVKLVTITQVQENVKSDYTSTVDFPENAIWGAYNYGTNGRVIWYSANFSNEPSKDFFDAAVNLYDVCSKATAALHSLTETTEKASTSNDWSISNIASSSTDSLYVSSNFCDSANYSAYTLTSLEDSVNKIINEYMEKEKEKENSKMNFKNYFKFGPEYCRSIRLSTYGPAFQSNDGGAYLSYDKTTSTWVDVANLTFDFKNAYFALPVGIDALNEGDYILHNGQWVRVNYIETIDGHTTIRVDNPWTKTIYSVLPERSIFGFNYYTKLVGLMDNALTNASAENPFGNPLLLMAMSEGTGSFKEMLPLLLMQNTDNNALTSNPLLLMMMFGDK